MIPKRRLRRLRKKRKVFGSIGRRLNPSGLVLLLLLLSKALFYTPEKSESFVFSPYNGPVTVIEKAEVVEVEVRR